MQFNVLQHLLVNLLKLVFVSGKFDLLVAVKHVQNLLEELVSPGQFYELVEQIIEVKDTFSKIQDLGGHSQVLTRHHTLNEGVFLPQFLKHFRQGEILSH